MSTYYAALKAREWQRPLLRLAEVALLRGDRASARGERYRELESVLTAARRRG